MEEMERNLKLLFPTFRSIFLFILGRYFWITLNDAHKYRGAWHRETIHGNGIFKYSNGSIYTGGFHRGLKHGQGHYISSSCYEYDGEWLSGKQTGKAFIKYKNGDVYEGHVLNGLRNGIGELFQSHTQRCFKGCWKYNELVGEFKLIDPKFSFTGSTDQHYNKGNGKISYNDGSEYIGDIDNYQRIGSGTLKLSSGKSISGDWISDMNVKNATMIDEHGFVWSGEFKDLKPIGLMKTKRSDGLIYDSYWSKGQMLKSLGKSFSN